jgi:hypothetical protein
MAIARRPYFVHQCVLHWQGPDGTDGEILNTFDFNPTTDAAGSYVPPTRSCAEYARQINAAFLPVVAEASNAYVFRGAEVIEWQSGVRANSFHAEQQVPGTFPGKMLPPGMAVRLKKNIEPVDVNGNAYPRRTRGSWAVGGIPEDAVDNGGRLSPASIVAVTSNYDQFINRLYQTANLADAIGPCVSTGFSGTVWNSIHVPFLSVTCATTIRSQRRRQSRR